MALAYQFYSRPEYFKDLIDRVSKTAAGDRVMVASMPLDVSIPLVGKVVEELAAAARRQVQVDLIVDAFTFLAAGSELRPGPLFWYNRLPKHMPARFRQQLEALENLKQAGGRYTVTNRPARALTRPFAGRSHLKFAVINNRIYLGGCNLNESNKIDLMVGWQDKAIAKWLIGLTDKIAVVGNVNKALGGKDLQYKLADGSKLLVDSGVPGRSLIYKEILGLIDGAEQSIFVACPYHPNAATLKHLAAAVKRGVKVRLVYNNPFRHGLIAGSAHAVLVLGDRLRAPSVLFKGQLPRSTNFLHAKLLVTEHGTLIGSHNLIQAGVKFGTAEIAYFNNDPEFAAAAVETILRQL